MSFTFIGISRLSTLRAPGRGHKAEELAVKTPIEKGEIWMGKALDYMGKATRYGKTVGSSSNQTGLLLKVPLDEMATFMGRKWDELNLLVNEKKINTETAIAKIANATPWPKVPCLGEQTLNICNL
jgi:hypothetical protein